MAKYKDPKLFVPQLLLSFFAQDVPLLPKKDGGLKSRLSYLLMPFEFCECPEAGTNQRPMDINVKLAVDSLVTELLMWACLLAPGLKAKNSRVLLPRPLKVVEDTEAQYLSSAAAPAPRDLTEVAIEFADAHLREWTKDMGKPSSRL